MVTTLRLMPTSPSGEEGGTSVGGVRDVSGTPVRYVSGTICQACIRTSQGCDRRDVCNPFAVPLCWTDWRLHGRGIHPSHHLTQPTRFGPVQSRLEASASIEGAAEAEPRVGDLGQPPRAPQGDGRRHRSHVHRTSLSTALDKGSRRDPGLAFADTRPWSLLTNPPRSSISVRPATDGHLRLAELVGALSLGIDLGFGQPMEHVLRQCLIALRLAEQVGLAEEERATVYYTALLINVGCHTDAHEQAKWFGDDIAL